MKYCTASERVRRFRYNGDGRAGIVGNDSIDKMWWEMIVVFLFFLLFFRVVSGVGYAITGKKWQGVARPKSRNQK